MLGTEGALDESIRADAVGEIANVVCGNVVPALGTLRDVFVLDPPAVVKLTPGQSVGAGDSVVLPLYFDRGRAEINLVSTALAKEA